MRLGKYKLFWVLLFAAGTTVIVTLATSWNIVLVQLEEVKKFWTLVVLGGIGFLVVFAALVLLFTKVLLEMRFNQQQSDFLATVTHELKTPVASLELSSGLLIQGDAGSIVLQPSERKRLWAAHQKELSRLKQEINSLLEAARNDAVAPKESWTVIDLNQWVSNHVPRWKDLLGEASTITVEIKDEPVYAKVKLETLDRIADNLIDNARKFSINGVYLKISIFSDSTFFSLNFEDKGIGFEKKDRKKLFQRFYRASLSDKKRPGTGLGLFIAKQAAKRSKLKLSAWSEGKNKGATFILKGRKTLTSPEMRVELRANQP